MKLGKNDRFVIALGLSVLIIALMITNVILPKKEAIAEKTANLEILENQYDMTINAASSGFTTSDLELQKKQFSDYKNSFYDVKDSYSIDKVLNELCQENSVALDSMQLSTATPVSTQDATNSSDGSDVATEPATQVDSSATTMPQVLYGMTASVTLTGADANIMNFIDQLDALGKSVVITNVSFSTNERASEEDYSTLASITAVFYGISVPDYEEQDIEEPVSEETNGTED